ncbi:MAG: cofactor-independent phosphoglycerate mutase [Candidatus Omnitrophica bacterium CG11_big_fil_rev_8_21_14_0_20_63_9]|nr:MAG: cofactor-independent phosphoglycerate mutase [Candidatus Omnitrophica bacterium CG11_big_fil_rev_8_21_14_0_20_63_9]
MKYIILLPDGVADVPINELGNKTPLEVAKHPNMDWVAREGVTGWNHTIPSGFPPGSDVGCMSVFGYDPRKYHTGRAPLEAAAQGIALKPGQVAFRCNTLTVEHGVMVDHSADHITTEESKQLIEAISGRLGKDAARYYPGVSYRHLMVIDGAEYAKTQCTPPHDILGKRIDEYLPKGPGAELLRRHMEQSVGILKDHAVSKQRSQQGKRAATMTWFWGQGTAVQFPPFAQAYKKKAACISAVDIVRGIARLAGMEILQVPGITGYFDTNYENKADYALKALDEGFDLVVVHVESTDEAGHMGDPKKKVQAIEDVDRRLLGRLLDGLRKRNEPFAVLITPDHPTSCALRTHIADPVPFALYATGTSKGGAPSYNEPSIKASAKRFEEGYQLMSFFLSHS